MNRLLITHDIFGSWDLPGGRLKKEEFDKPLETVVERKVREELGPNVRYKLGKPVVFFRVERIEHDSIEKARIFAVGYEAVYSGGEVKLGKHHDQMKWVDVVVGFKPEQYFKGGWLEGIQEYTKGQNA